MLIFQKIALIFTVIGGLNWGLIGFFDFNLVTWLFQEDTMITNLVYIVVGICALFNVGILFFRQKDTM